jgi:hypothetical protein
MPTKRCCCGPCYEYSDGFQRTSNDETLLEPDWEVCGGDWTDWEINPSSPAFTGIVSRASDSKMVLKHMVGHPYGIFTATIEADTVGQKFRIYAFHGSLGTPCGSPTDTYTEIEVIDTNEITQRIVVGGSVEFEESYVVTDATLIWTVCMGDNLFESSVSGGLTQRYCGTASGYWFAIGAGSSTVTKWSEITYSDHYLHNTTCPRCARSCCFPTVNRTIAAFDVTIADIESNNCTCLESVSVRVTLQTGVGFEDQCGCNPSFAATVTGPHDCFAGNSQISVVLLCNATTGEKTLQLQILPDDNGQNEWNWFKGFGSSALPEDMRIDDDYDSSDPGDEGSCRYENATITVTPVVVAGCCDEAPEETSLAIHEVRAVREKINELPYEQHEAVIAQLRELVQPEDKGLGDTATRVLGDWEQPELSRLVRCWLRFYSCRRSEALKMVNRHFPYPDR